MSMILVLCFLKMKFTKCLPLMCCCFSGKVDKDMTTPTSTMSVSISNILTSFPSVPSVTSVPSLTSPSSISQPPVLLHHNQIRADVGVQPLMWDDELAVEAKQYADYLQNSLGCSLVHSGKQGQGENLAWASSGMTMLWASEMWYGEKEKYIVGSVITADNYQEIGHYTQQVWKSTEKLGCGISDCGAVVCRYTPPGNFLGQAPY